MRILIFIVVAFIAIGAAIALLIERGENPFTLLRRKAL